jgi:hypothetical protein
MIRIHKKHARRTIKAIDPMFKTTSIYGKELIFSTLGKDKIRPSDISGNLSDSQIISNEKTGSELRFIGIVNGSFMMRIGDNLLPFGEVDDEGSYIPNGYRARSGVDYVVDYESFAENIEIERSEFEPAIIKEE